MKFFLVSVFLVFSISNAHALDMNDASTGECKDLVLDDGQKVNYCVLGPTTSVLPQNIIYYFHGTNGSARDIYEPAFKYIYYVMTYLVGNHIPYLVGISLGPATPVDFMQSRMLDIEDKVFPHIEGELKFGVAHPTRHLLGGSLGGFSALNVAAHRPDSYKSVAALCPALLPFNIFSETETNEYIERNRQNLNQVYFNELITDARHTYANAETWYANDPISFARQGKYDSLNVFVSTGQQDTYGFYEGETVLQNVLSARPSQAMRDFEPTSGPHCSFSTVGLIKFLSQQMTVEKINFSSIEI